MKNRARNIYVRTPPPLWRSAPPARHPIRKLVLLAPREKGYTYCAKRSLIKPTAIAQGASQAVL
jgi:hypothetical protein